MLNMKKNNNVPFAISINYFLIDFENISFRFIFFLMIEKNEQLFEKYLYDFTRTEKKNKLLTMLRINNFQIARKCLLI